MFVDAGAVSCCRPPGLVRIRKGSFTGVVAAASAPGTGPPGACWARLPVVLVSCVREDCRDESCDRKDVFPLDSLSRRPLKLVLATVRRIRPGVLNPCYHKD
ncbi:hypothetical protein ACLKA7_005018 [Drosophila subpalustris]